MTLSPWLTTICDGSNVNTLNFQAPVLSGGVNLTPPPAGIVEFGNFSGGAGSGPVGIPFRFAKPSRCTVFIQNSLLVDWFGLDAIVEFAAAVC